MTVVRVSAIASLLLQVLVTSAGLSASLFFVSSSGAQEPVMLDRNPALKFETNDHSVIVTITVVDHKGQSSLRFPVDHAHFGKCGGFLYVSGTRIAYDPVYTPDMKQDAFDVLLGEVTEAKVLGGYLSMKIANRVYNFELLEQRGSEINFGHGRTGATRKLDEQVGRWLGLALKDYSEALREFQHTTASLRYVPSAEQQAIVDREDAAGFAAEQKGQFSEALQHYLSALQSLPLRADPETDGTIREHAIKIALMLNPPPAIPEDAHRHAAFAVTAIRDAGDDPSRLDSAVGEWREVLRLAPWWPEANFNLGLTLEKQQRYAEAARYLKMYLLAAPTASDRDAVLQKIYSLEYRPKE
jgi:tetratricopeptide (TPR) repeat protein